MGYACTQKRLSLWNKRLCCSTYCQTCNTVLTCRKIRQTVNVTNLNLRFGGEGEVKGLVHYKRGIVQF